MTGSTNRSFIYPNIGIGIALPIYGNIASPEAIAHMSVEAENMGCASLWVSDRMFLPTKPKDTFNDGPWPRVFATVYDPLETLTYAASLTKHVKLGSSVICALFHNPIILAKRFATLDRLSGGRVIAGIGQGDFKDEFEVANVPMSRRGRGFEEFVSAMRATWGPDPVSFSGDFYRIPESHIGPKPIQLEGIPLIFGAFAPRALERAARMADGLTTSLSRRTKLESLGQTIETFRSDARKAGRDPEKLKVYLRVHTLHLDPLKEPERLLIGSPKQIQDDLSRLEEVGVNHVIFDMLLDEIPIDAQLRLLSKFIESIKN
jgi:probable F420-dependent oxidoreductase